MTIQVSLPVTIHVVADESTSTFEVDLRKHPIALSDANTGKFDATKYPPDAVDFSGDAVVSSASISGQVITITFSGVVGGAHDLTGNFLYDT